MELLDDQAVLAQRDPERALKVIAEEWRQVTTELAIINPSPRRSEVRNVVIAGMGGSGLASDMLRDWIDLSVPYEVVKSYDLPAYVDESTLVVASSFSGNTEETLSAIDQALARGAQTVVITKGGTLLDVTKEHNVPYIQMEWDYQPRMGMFINLNGLVRLLAYYGVIEPERSSELAALAPWLQAETNAWLAETPSADNPAKQLAWWCAGKTPVIFASSELKSLAYKWKISFNENSKNVAYHNELPEFDHNEFIGWSSHPVEKPFAPIDLRSSLDHPRISKRFELGERLLSGRRPAPKRVELQGDSRLAQLLWGAIYADFVSVYLGILNGVDPMKVALVEKLKHEMK
ncbi:MAG TPA: bifunctional phosphoglucose/phosphomannose isomerase [Candidatus Saccharimonadales bacterium]|jgi:glucose/mannose-6-phosphate isomerase